MPTPLRALIAAGAAAALLCVALAPLSSARAAEPAAQLSVTLTNSEKTVKAGDDVTFTGHVKNLGETEASVTITLEAPGYVELGAASGATVEKNTATWTPTIAPGSDAAFSIPATIGRIPSSERRVTTVASVYAAGGSSPIVRTANASHISGVKDTPGAKAAAAATSQKKAPSALPWIVGGAVLVLLALTAGLLLVLRGRGRRLRRGSSRI